MSRLSTSKAQDRIHVRKRISDPFNGQLSDFTNFSAKPVNGPGDFHRVFLYTGMRWKRSVAAARGLSIGSSGHWLIDGKPSIVLHRDTYGSQVEWNRRTPVAQGLEKGMHTVMVKVTGEKHADSSNTYVQIVGFDVRE